MLHHFWAPQLIQKKRTQRRETSTSNETRFLSDYETFQTDNELSEGTSWRRSRYLCLWHQSANNGKLRQKVPDDARLSSTP